MLVTSSLKSCMPGFSIMQTKNFQMSKLSLEKEEKPEIKFANIRWITEKPKEFQKNIYLCFVNYTKAYDGVQFSSVVQLRPTLCDPSDFSTSGFPVHHQLLELAQTQVHWVGDAIQPSHPLSSPSPPAFNLSQHQGLFQRASSSHQVAKVLELQHQFFQWIFDWVNHNELWKALKEMGIPDHLTCLPRNLYAGQEATVRTLYGTTD